MIRRLSLVIAFACTSGVVACNKTEAPPKPSTAPPAQTEAPAPAPPDATAAPEPAATTETASAGWRPTKCSEYTYKPKDCHGSPENPECVDSFKLQPDGKADKVFDDIMARGTYEVSGTTVTIRVPDMKYEGTFTIQNDGEVLVGKGDARYQRADCP
ncbi:MAG: hypothetical protein JRI23_23820 [Deltaproteobacteria bacterium]|jgi:hypothetical protein|nr:hypothetical protein [Deltaproteobacteria bacterium]MBW2535020.1 hypothetical protein [Deltaproteobacteria bacterium]